MAEKKQTLDIKGPIDSSAPKDNEFFDLALSGPSSVGGNLFSKRSGAVSEGLKFSGANLVRSLMQASQLAGSPKNTIPSFSSPNFTAKLPEVDELASAKELFKDIAESHNYAEQNYKGENLSSLFKKFSETKDPQDFNRFLDYTTNQVAQQIPQQVVLWGGQAVGIPVPLTLGVLGASSAGQSYLDDKEQAPQLSESQMRQRAAISGFTEYASEYGTIGLKGAAMAGKSALEVIPGVKQLMARGLASSSAKLFLKMSNALGGGPTRRILINALVNALGEGGEEVANQAVQIMSDEAYGVRFYTLAEKLDSMIEVFGISAIASGLVGSPMVTAVEIQRAVDTQAYLDLERSAGPRLHILQSEVDKLDDPTSIKVNVLPSPEGLFTLSHIIKRYKNGLPNSRNMDNSIHIVSADVIALEALVDSMIQNKQWNDAQEQSKLGMIGEEIKKQIFDERGFARISNEQTPEEKKPDEPEAKERGLSKSVEASAIQKELVGDFGNLPTYKSRDMKKVAEQVDQFINTNPELAKKIALGEAEEINNLRAQEIFTGLRAKAMEEGDVELIKELALSESASAIATELGQRIKALDSGDTVNPVRSIQEVIQERKLAEKEGRFTPLPKKDIQEIEELKAKLSEAERKLKNYQENRASRPSFGSKNKIFTKSLADEARARLREKISGLRSGIDPTAVVELTQIGGFYFEGGIVNFTEWSSVLIKEFGESVKPFLDEVWARVQSKFKEAEYVKITEKIKDIPFDAENRGVLSASARQMAEFFVSEGITERDKLVEKVHSEFVKVYEGITKREVSDLISGYGQYKELSDDAVKAKLRDISGQLQQISKLEDMQQGQAPLKTGVERRTPSDEERRLIKLVEEAKKKYNIKTSDPSKQLKSALDSLKTRLVNQIADLQLQISERKKIVKEKTPLILDDKARKLMLERDALKEEFKKIFGQEKMSYKQRLKIAMDSVNKSIQEYQKRLNERDFSPLNKQASPLQNKELDSLRAKRDALRQAYKKMKDALTPKRSPEEIALQSLKTRMQTEKERLEKRLSQKDFSKRESKPVILDEEGRKIKFEYDALRQAYKDARDASNIITDDEMNIIIGLAKDVKNKENNVKESSPDRSPERLEYGRAYHDYLEFVGDLKIRAKRMTWNEFKTHPLSSMRKIAFGLGGLTKSLMASLDNSVVGRQGLKVLVDSPKVWLKNSLQTFVDIFKTFNAKDVMREIKADVLSRKNAMNGLYRKHKLAVGIKEESYPVSWPSKIPLLGRAFKASEAAFTGFAFRSRADIFDKLVEISKKQQGINLDVAAELANSLTGRGSLGSFEQGGEIINRFLFSARFLRSQVDFLLVGAGMKDVDRYMRTRMALNLLKAISGIGLILWIVNAFDDEAVEFDARSSDFGKIKIGNTSYDITGGMASLVVLATRLMTGYSKSSTSGEVRKLDTGKYGEYGTKDVVFSFAENKLSPAASFLLNIREGERFGKKETLPTKLGKLVTPITLQNIAETKDEKLANRIGAVIADSLGVSATTYPRFPEIGETINEVIGEVKKSKAYNALSDEEKEKVINSLSAKIRTQAKINRADKIVGDGPDMGKKISELLDSGLLTEESAKKLLERRYGR